MTEASLRRRFKKLLEDAVELARERGAMDPEIYFECDGMVVTDGPPHEGASGVPCRDRVVLDIGWPKVPFGIGVGSW